MEYIVLNVAMVKFDSLLAPKISKCHFLRYSKFLILDDWFETFKVSAKWAVVGRLIKQWPKFLFLFSTYMC